MKFGPVPLDEAEGALLAHSQKLSDGKLAKGTRLDASAVDALRAAGLAEVIVAQLSENDLHENAAAGAIAEALVPDPQAAGLSLTEPFTGRVNLVAEVAGIAELDEEAIHQMNMVDPMLTLATVPAYARVTPGMLVGTVKIISYGVDGDLVDKAAEIGRAAVRVRQPEYATAGLVLTELSDADARLRDKSVAAIQSRLEALGLTLAETAVTAHETSAIATTLSGMTSEVMMLLTASATSDIDDVGPSAVRLAGGTIERFGMPVDPGNLLFVGALGPRPVIGLPGCARSPALNGADWVLERVVCGIPPSDRDIARMGVGGLLKEIPSRPQPRRSARR